MREIVLLAVLAGMMLLALRRPFLFVLTYCYIDIVAPQRLGYHLIDKLPLSLIAFALAFLGWLFSAHRQRVRIDQLQIVLVLLLAYCGYTTLHADFPAEALAKWSWVWKALIWSIFLPLVLTTRLRIEALALTMVLSASALVISGGLKTAVGGGGYGSLQILISDNSGLFEGSIISMAAIAMIPLILWLAMHGTVFKPDLRVRLFAGALVFACLLIPIGTQARTGLVCAALLVLLGLRDVRQRALYVGAIALAAMVAVPFLPSKFTSRMDTIGSYQADDSANTRVAVWKWTWDYVQDHPMGGGFDAYRQNELIVDRVVVDNSGGTESRTLTPYTDKARAYHNSYFEMMGEQGFVGLGLWLTLHLVSLMRMEMIRRRYRRPEPGQRWIKALATALQGSQLVYLTGSMFVGIAFQPFIYMLIAMQIGLHTYVRRKAEVTGWAAPDVQPGTPAQAFSR